ncbi:MAG: hypothetical protein PVH19_02750 [Planctomycetia bacterium]
MDARGKSIAGIAVLLFLFITMGASYQTSNFIVQTNDPLLARQIAEAAEQYRSRLSVSWLGESIPNWSSPCVMKVRVGRHLGAGGATTFLFDRGEVYGWRMTIQGSRERIFDSVLPHEITHMILASHFRQPLPRWADEGAATSVECSSERQKQYQSLHQFLTTGRGIAFNRMFAMTEYPSDIMPLYAQGFSLTEYLIQQKGRREYIRFLESAIQNGDWSGALQKHYGVDTLGRLQTNWLAWIRQGRPTLTPAAPSNPVVVASHQAPVGNRNRSAIVPATAVTTFPAPSTAGSTLASIATPKHVASSDGWHVRGKDYSYATPTAPNPYAETLVPSGSGSKVAQGWVDPRTVVSQPGRFEELPADEMTPIEPSPSENPYAIPQNQSQVARPQPVQEARQVILEWHLR